MFKPTQQQQAIIDTAKTGKNIAIKAFAGASKTTTCVMVSEELVKSSLYLAFNKDIAEEAKTKFGQHVTCQTVHSLAYKAIVKFPKSNFGRRLQANLSFDDIKKVLTFFPECEELFYTLSDKDVPVFDEDKQFSFLLDVRILITLFCQSKHFNPKVFFAEYLVGTDYPTNYSAALVMVATDYWRNLILESSDFVISHDIYLKMYHLTKPVLPFDIIYLDEAQDSNPVTLDLFLSQKHTQKIIVGDPYQAIYGWRGALNAFDMIPKNEFSFLSLTESFRFTPEIAKLASKVISISVNGEEPVIGLADKTNKVCVSHAIICRNNTTILENILVGAFNNKKIYTNVNLKEIFAKVYHISALWYNQEPKFPVKELAQYKTYQQLLIASEKMSELKTLIQLTQTLSTGDGVFTNVKKIKEALVDDASKADFVISTGHKSKGLEFDHVTLSEDFLRFGEDTDINDWILQNLQELNLLYVALTRAKYELVLPDSIIDFIHEFSN